jgi:hypothetical protein
VEQKLLHLCSFEEFNMRQTLLLGLMLVTLAGCGINAASMPPPATTIVTGKALKPNWIARYSWKRIRFAPAEGGSGGAESYADIKADGTFTLQSFGGKDGTMPGTYKVSLSGKALDGIDKKFSEPSSSTITKEVTMETKDIGSITFK